MSQNYDSRSGQEKSRVKTLTKEHFRNLVDFKWFFRKIVEYRTRVLLE